MREKYTLKSVFAALMFTGFTTGASAQAYTENFDDITTLSGSGWFQQNNSSPVGTNPVWFQGTATTATPTPGPFDAYNGAVNAYIACNFNSTAGGTGTISNWLVTPNRTLRNGDVFQFYTRKPTIGTGQTDYPDRLEVRMSTNGASTNVGATATATGDFTTLLLSINPTLTTNVYPQTWTQYTITISGLPAPTSGRIAFRYYVTSAGPTGTNSDYIGVDNVVYTPYVCPVVNITPTSVADGTAGVAYSSTLSQTGALGAPSYAVTAGALPPGLTLSASGTISGTPTATGTYNFTVSVSDASGCTGSTAYSITIVCPINGATLSTPPSLCTNGTPYTLVEGSPAGGTYSGAGVSGGMFDPSSGSQIITYTLVDPYGCTQTTNNAYTVNTPPVVSASSDAVANTICAGASVTLTGSGADTYVWDNSVTDGVAFTPSATAIYTVTGTATSTGCSAAETITVNVNALPAVTASSDAVANTVCQGAAVTLSGTGADSYAWDNSVVDGVAFTVSATADYIVTGTNITTGCSAKDTITITVNPLPMVDLPAFTGMLCDYSPVLTLSGGSPSGGVYSGTSVTASTFDPAIGAGMYVITYTYTDANSCVNSDTSSITVSVCAGIATNAAVQNVMVYPNPGNGAFTVEFNQAVAGEVIVRITDIQGKLIAGEELSNFAGAYKKNFDLSSMDKGMYLLEVTGNNTHFVSKVILK